MDRQITYCNTDLDLTSSEDLTALAGAFGAASCVVLHVTHSEGGPWCATLEADLFPNEEPELIMAAMLAVIESLEEPLRSVWSRCEQREFNIGYECGDEPWAFNQGLSKELVARIAAVGASLRITIYPHREAQ
jgi:hypothetical protein